MAGALAKTFYICVAENSADANYVTERAPFMSKILTRFIRNKCPRTYGLNVSGGLAKLVSYILYVIYGSVLIYYILYIQA